MTNMDSQNKPALKLYLASPRGFCAGVVRAIEIVERALAVYGPPIYVRHEIVHNRRVVSDLEAKGVIFVDELDKVPEGAKVVFSAHGVPKTIPKNAANQGLFAFDATCPLVSKVHRQVERHFKEGRHILLIGHRGHPEVIGTMGQLPEGTITLIETKGEIDGLDFAADTKLAYATQTTLSVSDTAEIIAALQQKYPDIKAPKQEDICYATTNRQNAVKSLAEKCDMILVIGAPNSSNANRLVEVAKMGGAKSFLVQSAADLSSFDFAAVQNLGITAGASAPEILTDEIIAHLAQYFTLDIETITTANEDIQFKLPKELA